jgi:hypothetical protein
VSLFAVRFFPPCIFSAVPSCRVALSALRESPASGIYLLATVVKTVRWKRGRGRWRERKESGGLFNPRVGSPISVLSKRDAVNRSFFLPCQSFTL